MNRHVRHFIYAIRDLTPRKIIRELANNKKKIATGVGIAAIAISCGVIVYKTTPLNRVVENKVVPNAAYRSDIDPRPIGRAAYVSETAFQNSVLPYDCYNIPFKKTDGYVTNIQTLKDMKRSGEDYNTYLKRAKKFVSVQFNNSYRDILKGQDKFVNSVTALYGANGSSMADTDSGKEMTSKKMAEDLMQWYVDNKAELRSTFTTGQSMIYRDGINDWVRGVWTVTPNCSQTACDKFNEMYGTNLKKGEKQYYVIEVCMYMQNPDDIIGYTFFKQITGK